MISPDDYQIFQDIINYRSISPKISGFFEMLKSAAENNTAPGIISTLNTMLKENEPLRIMISKKNKKEDIKVDLLTWYELLRSIYTVKWHNLEKMTGETKNTVFQTFSRTFENPSFYPEYWFEPAGEKKSLLRRIISPDELRIAFDRFMYDSEGGTCCTALDFNLKKYIFNCVCAPAGKLADYENPCEKIASLILTANNIAAGRSGFYISESMDVDLQYAGIKLKNPNLLKYYHFDKFSRLSYIRSRERDTKFDTDAVMHHPEFELQWYSLAAATEFILMSKDARATPGTCSRVSTGTIMKCLNKLAAVPEIRENPQAAAMIEAGINLLDDNDFHQIPNEEVLKRINCGKKLISPMYYLHRYDIDSAEQFWDFVNPVFEAFVEKFNDKYYALMHRNQITDHAPNSKLSTGNDSSILLMCLELNQPEELRGRLSGARLRAALKTLLVNGSLEFHCRQLGDILQNNFIRERFQFFSPQTGREIPLTLPWAWVCSDLLPKEAPEVLNSWARDILTETGRNKDKEITLNFSEINFSSIREISDKTWEIFFSSEYEAAVKSRYIISLLEARKILKDGKDKYNGIKLVSGNARLELLNYLEDELHTLTGNVEVDLEKEKADFAGQHIPCFAGFRPTGQRPLVILDILARLVVAASENETLAAVWADREQRLRFITHILSATHSGLAHPFPFHIGLQGDSLLRLSRGGADQSDHLSRLANHDYSSIAEQYCFLISLSRHLSGANEPQKALQTIIDTPCLAEFAEQGQLEHFKTFIQDK